MNVLIFFMESVFQNQVHGGSTVILRYLADALAANGDAVTILCRYRSNNRSSFRLNKRTIVKPTLKFKEVFPDAYCTPPYHIASAIEAIYSESKRNDVFINFDSNFLFQDIFDSHLPTIHCLHDFIYSGALQGTFLFRKDTLIANSPYIKNVVLSTVGRFYPELDSRLILINNGVDVEKLRHVKPEKIFKYIPKHLYGKILLLCPHRPEDGKGIFESLLVLKQLVYKYKHENVILLLPRGLDEAVSEDIRQFYKRVNDFVDENVLSEHVFLHDWIPHDIISEYYSLAKITFCLGNQVESFGIVPLESILCDTPVIMSRVASYRYLLPEELTTKVDYGDIDAATKQVHNILEQHPNLERARKFIKKNYSMEKMTHDYLSVIYKRVKHESISFSPMTTDQFTLPPWCYISKKGIYNDYERSYRSDLKLMKLLSGGKTFTLHDARGFGFTQCDIMNELKKGYVTYQNYERTRNTFLARYTSD